MKEYIKYLLLGMVLVFAISTVVFIYQDVTTPPEEDPRIAEAKARTKEQDIYWYSTMNKVAYVAVLGVCLACIVMLTYSIAKSRLKKAAVHTYKIGSHSEILIHEKDLSTLAGPVALGLTNAEQLKQMNRGVEQAFNLANRMREAEAKQIQAIVGKRGVMPAAPYIAGTVQDQFTLPASSAPTVPTFHKLLLEEEIAPGKPMILGYEDDLPRRGSFLDIYSAAIAGESGSGKTSTMLFLIGSGLVACGVRFFGIDPHYPHPNSLAAKTKPLWETGQMHMATDERAMLNVLATVESLIDARLQQKDTDTTPVVFVIDELAYLSKTRMGGKIAHTMERISTEGRKCAVYMLASSQTWLVARTGDSSVVRDTLTSAYVHRIKPKQANLLLQDKEEADKVKKYIKQVGEVLFCPVGDESVVCKMPYTTEADMMMVAEMLGSQGIQIFPSCEQHTAVSVLSGAQTPGEWLELPSPSPAKMIEAPKPLPDNLLNLEALTEQLREQMHSSGLDEKIWRKQLAEKSGVLVPLLTKVLDGKCKLTAETARKLLPHLAPEEKS